jgi:hypothetical protein
MIFIVLIYNIILINLLIAMLANTFDIFDAKSKGLYLSEILLSRDEMNYDESYGAFLAAIPPINYIQLPFVPLALVLRYNSPLLKELNRRCLQIQYLVFMLIFFVYFAAVSVALLPVAYILAVIDKISTLHLQPNFGDKLKNNLLFIPFGIPILLFDLISDLVYFWIDKFKSKEDLNVIIVPFDY